MVILLAFYAIAVRISSFGITWKASIIAFFEQIIIRIKIISIIYIFYSEAILTFIIFFEKIPFCIVAFGAFLIKLITNSITFWAWFIAIIIIFVKRYIGKTKLKNDVRLENFWIIVTFYSIINFKKGSFDVHKKIDSFVGVHQIYTFTAEKQ